MERQRKKQRTRAEPVRFDHELGVPRGTLASCILGCKYDHQREGNKLKRKKRMDRYGLASLPPATAEKGVTCYTKLRLPSNL